MDCFDNCITSLCSLLSRSIMFEYHSLSPWAEMKLEDTVHMLDLLGMDCFFQGTGRLWPVTGN